MPPLLKGFYTKPKRRTTLVTTVIEQPPPQKNKKKKTSSPSFSSLPDEILLNCLSRTSKSQYRVLSVFSKSVRSLVFSQELYIHRARLGNTEPCLYLCEEFSSLPDRWFALDRTLVTDGWIKDELSLLPITPSSSAPSKSTNVAVGFEIYQIGGTIINNDNKQPSSAVRVLDCRTHTWRDAPNMTMPRKRAHIVYLKDGKIYVYGGTEVKEEFRSGEVFDLKTQIWSPLTTRWSPITTPGPWNKIRGRPWCVIENVFFCLVMNTFRWYDSERGKMFIVEGLEDLKPVICYDTVQLANYGGKLMILLHKLQRLEFLMTGKTRKHLCKNKRIWCAVIRLEKRIGSSGLEIFGETERSNAVLTVPSSYKIFDYFFAFVLFCFVFTRE